MNPRPDHAQYLKNWLQILGDDPKAIFTAASAAQKAVEWCEDKQPPWYDDPRRPGVAYSADGLVMVGGRVQSLPPLPVAI